MSRLLRLYPPRWRRRYEAEFRALLDEYPLSFRDKLEMVRGAVMAWLNPRYGRWMGRAAAWVAVAALLTAALIPALLTLPSTPAEASPRYPVVLFPGRDAEAWTFQFAVSHVQRTIPHLILSLDSHRSWRVLDVLTERAPESQPYHIVHAAEMARGPWRHIWDFGRVEPGQRVRLTVDFSVVRPKAFEYTLEGYGDVTASGKPDVHAPLTNTIAYMGFQNFGTTGPEPFRYLSGKPGCDQTEGIYRLCEGGDFGRDNMQQDFYNAGPAISHLVVQFDSYDTWSLEAAVAAGWSHGVPHPVTPRVMRSRPSVYTLDFGRLRHNGQLHVRLAITPSRRKRLEERESAYAGETADGKPDPTKVIFGGGEVVRFP